VTYAWKHSQFQQQIFMGSPRTDVDMFVYMQPHLSSCIINMS